AAVAAVRSTERDRALPAERHAAGAAVTTADIQLRFVDEPAHRTTCGYLPVPKGGPELSVPWARGRPRGTCAAMGVDHARPRRRADRLRPRRFLRWYGLH